MYARKGRICQRIHENIDSRNVCTIHPFLQLQATRVLSLSMTDLQKNQLFLWQFHAWLVMLY